MFDVFLDLIGSEFNISDDLLFVVISAFSVVMSFGVLKGFLLVLEVVFGVGRR